jgi:hypothetical protein
LRGDIAWVSAATELELIGLGNGSTVLDLETRPLGETVPEIVQAHPLWCDFPQPGQTAFGLFESTLRDAISGNRDSDLIDRNVLASIGKFSALLSMGYDSCTFGGDGPETVAITPEGLRAAGRLLDETPPGQKTIITGVLDRMNRRTFLLSLDSGTLRGVLPSGSGTNDYRGLLGEKVVIDGEASFRPSREVSMIVAHAVRHATPQDAVWGQAPRAAPRSLGELSPRATLPPGASAFGCIFGKWPGTESDEEVAAALAEMS